MTKWEYLYVEVDKDEVKEVNGKMVGEFKGFFMTITGRPTISEFLEKSGQEGWEVVSICPASETANQWRLVLKRPIQG